MITCCDTGQRHEGRTGQPIGRVLWSTGVARRPSISGRRCRRPLAVYPQARAGRPRTPARVRLSEPFLTLLRVGFTEPPESPQALVSSYLTVSPLPLARRGGLLSVALSRGSPRVGVTDHPALWSPDLPRRRRGVATAAPDATARPARPPYVQGYSARAHGRGQYADTSSRL